MRFAHLADVHIGSWRDPAMKELSMDAFKRAIAIVIGKQLDFLIISGDLFNTALPAIDHLQETVILLKKLKQKSIPVYIVPGSHDYNAGGRTILDVLEEAEMLINVIKGSVIDGKLRLKFTSDSRTGAKLTGLGGRRGSLEKKEYSTLDLASLEDEPGFKIFLFHSAIDELKPDDLERMESMSAKELPKGFDYYAGGHVHIVEHKDVLGRKNLVYPGPIFPASFSELWKLEKGGFYIYEDGRLEFQPLELKKIIKLELDAEGKSPENLNKELESFAEQKTFADSIVIIRAAGKLLHGRPGDVDFRSLFRELYAKGAFFVMRNTSRLTSEEFSEVKVHSGTADEIEDEMIRNHLSEQKHKAPGIDADMVKSLIRAMSEEQRDGEKKYEYEERIRKDVDKLFHL
ncbi:MAG: metallophosphoesterase [archaeon]